MARAEGVQKDKAVNNTAQTHRLLRILSPFRRALAEEVLSIDYSVPEFAGESM
jgi:hypothetical protein